MYQLPMLNTGLDNHTASVRSVGVTQDNFILWSGGNGGRGVSGLRYFDLVTKATTIVTHGINGFDMYQGEFLYVTYNNQLYKAVLS
jgi:hypothetical protein